MRDHHPAAVTVEAAGPVPDARMAIQDLDALLLLRVENPT